MRSRFSAWSLSALLLATVACSAQPQVDIPTALVKSSRVIVLPFANYTEVPDLRRPLLRSLRERLTQASIEVVDSGDVAAVLRAERIRNTLELSVAELQTLSSQLDAAYVMTGAVHRLVMTDEFAEFSLAAYLIYIPEARVDWCGTAVVSGGGAETIFTRAVISDTGRVIEKAVKKLFSDFEFGQNEQRVQVTAIATSAGGNGGNIPCHRVALVPLSNETSTPNAGEFLTDHLAVALYRRGFSVVLPGRIRESMIEAGDLTRGETSREVIASLAATCGADLILTGSVSDLTSAGESRFGDIPSLAMELRLIQSSDGQIIWARHLDRGGESSAALFGTGITTATGGLAAEAARAAVKKIPVVRKRVSPS